MEQAKVLIDLSHAHEQTAQDILAIATRPLAITHAGCASVHEHPRNKSDSLLRAVAETGGVFGLYEMSYLTPDLEQQSLEAFLRHIDHAVSVCGVEHVGIGSDTPFVGFDTEPESLAFWAKITQERQEEGIAAPGEGPPPYVEGLNGPHKMVALGEALQKRGYTAAQVDKILGQNFARLFEAVWT
jgi:membrane dipeptidase